MLNYNSTDPEHIKARRNVVPPSVEEIKELETILNALIYSALKNSVEPNYRAKFDSDITLLQRVLHDYQNKAHFYDVVGGWDGHNKPHLIYATQEWTETVENKSGWESNGWIFPEGLNEQDYEIEYVVEQDKFYNPTKATFKLNE